MGNLIRTAIISAAILLAVTGQAKAATTLGETFDPDGCAADTTYIQTVDPQNSYGVPFDGVITSWSYQASQMLPATAVQLKIATVAPGADLTMDADVTVVAQSAMEVPVAGVVNTFPTRIPVEGGQRIGEYVNGGGAGCSRQDPAYTDHFFGGANVQPGTTDLFTVEDFQQNISAVLEADADNDGFGDETQDGCPAEAANQGPCVPPETTITKGPKATTKKPKAKFKFASSDAGSTFQCKLKGKQTKKSVRRYAPCSSPKRYKNLKPGRYKFFVFATDTGGAADGSAAKLKFEVVG